MMKRMAMKELPVDYKTNTHSTFTQPLNIRPHDLSFGDDPTDDIDNYYIDEELD